jgi:hypothetical protein
MQQQPMFHHTPLSAVHPTNLLLLERERAPKSIPIFIFFLAVGGVESVIPCCSHTLEPQCLEHHGSVELYRWSKRHEHPFIHLVSTGCVKKGFFLSGLHSLLFPDHINSPHAFPPLIASLSAYFAAKEIVEREVRCHRFAAASKQPPSISGNNCMKVRWGGQTILLALEQRR